MKVVELRDVPPETKTRLLCIWEGAVRATHLFLSEADIAALTPVVAVALNQVRKLYAACESDGEIVGFMGTDGPKLEMLFVDAAQRGKGAGRLLVEYAVDKLGVKAVDVNEQNPGATGFYRHFGFEVTERTPLDAQGRPFPILRMKLAGNR